MSETATKAGKGWACIQAHTRPIAKKVLIKSLRVESYS
ncbi:hypothetical protein BN341_18230 [Helicobacter heilmannii ASB1.4]|uniref:Uncharacterized protein n=1 Tax=Helicobacter heilmannii TaxID=35817 RepID=A0A0K2Y7L4_HELHE|nr:hypothetical protein BN341_18230 [Helicobacter heilmannii ASB1.4]CRI33669.1 hypothetical protein HHE01_08730 [Helicobacter heilmannii]